jgi:hypothetical protein
VSDLKTITERAAEKKLRFLVIGGHAVVAHGYPRKTFDLDIVVPKSDVQKWRELVATLGYGLNYEGPTFLQYNAADLKDDPLDIMFVSDDIFGKFAAEALPSPPAGGGAKIISLLHLIALKCHSLKYGAERRAVKDADDVLRLMEINRLDPEAPEVSAVFLKHGTNEFYEKVRRICKTK